MTKERALALLEHTSDIITLHDEDGTVLEANASLARHLGYPDGSRIGDDPFGYIHPDDLPGVQEAWLGVLAEPGPAPPIRFRVRHQDGSYRWMESVATNRLGDAALRGIVTTTRDQTERIRMEEELDESRRRFQAVFEQVGVGIVVLDLEGRIVMANPAIASFLGGRLDQVIGKHAGAFMRPQDLEAEIRSVRALLRTGRRRYRSERRFIRLDGRTVHCRVTVTWLEPHDGGERNLIGMIEDVTDRKRAEARLAHDAVHDALTGLPNRVLLEDRLREALERTTRAGTKVAVLFLDIDGFKHVNDALGHVAGDRVLVDVARRLRSACRLSETVARFGGDEFVIVAEGVADERAALAVARRLVEAVRVPYWRPGGGSEILLDASVGIVLTGGPHRRPEDVLRDADTAMFEAKAHGGSGIEFFNVALRTRLLQRAQTEREIRRALERGEFRLVYQPVYDLSAMRIIGVEALMRWEHPREGLLPPARFIHATERTGLIDAVGAWALEEALGQGARWLGETPTEIRVAVNVSVRQIETNLPAKIEAALERTGFPAELLDLEITETFLMEDTALAEQVLSHLRALGVRVFIDDFGTGFSSLSYLHRFHVDGIKIDRSFVADVDTGGAGGEMVAAIVGIARALGLRTIAEGIERPAQTDALRALGCSAGQGYGLGHAVAPERISALLARERGLARAAI